ncbi:phosphatase PAP2 family protein [Cyclobacterium qasimii]|uniref:Uncharacterized protein n=1 Tax=Cyclobacterium qasimii M12-11B TaxID=641524 RepID=S7V5B0_9BACT|nr:phosphatase PAP2 family protein [Cyclobacterium qasimii]EPR65076.1 hypothetical protein ADICYQ_5921 [Cyclobacterium qasimii M12-11B]
MKQKIALIISKVGHPICLLLTFLVYFLFSIHDPAKAFWTLTIIISLGILPLIGWNLYRTRKGLYSNFDVSIRSQRSSMYRFILVLAVIVLAALWFSNQPSSVIIGSLILIQLLLLAFFLNYKIKISLHVAIAVFTGFGLWEINKEFSMIIWAFTPLIGWSRWYLGRHFPIELFWGFVLGIICGLEIIYFI